MPRDIPRCPFSLVWDSNCLPTLPQILPRAASMALKIRMLVENDHKIKIKTQLKGECSHPIESSFS